jgi:hypothetical protein
VEPGAVLVEVYFWRTAAKDGKKSLEHVLSIDDCCLGHAACGHGFAAAAGGKTTQTGKTSTSRPASYLLPLPSPCFYCSFSKGKTGKTSNLLLSQGLGRNYCLLIENPSGGEPAPAATSSPGVLPVLPASNPPDKPLKLQKTLGVRR